MIHFVDTEEFEELVAYYKREINTYRITEGIVFTRYAEPIYYELGFNLVCLHSAWRNYSFYYQDNNGYLMDNDPLRIWHYWMDWKYCVEQIMIKELFHPAKRDGVNFKNPYELTYGDYNIAGDYIYRFPQPAPADTSANKNQEKKKGGRTKDPAIAQRNAVIYADFIRYTVAEERTDTDAYNRLSRTYKQTFNGDIKAQIRRIVREQKRTRTDTN